MCSARASWSDCPRRRRADRARRSGAAAPKPFAPDQHHDGHDDPEQSLDRGSLAGGADRAANDEERGGQEVEDRLPPRCHHNFSVSSGTSLNKSPTRPRSATWKIGASSSLLMATISLESFMPARCWIAPDMPMAI